MAANRSWTLDRAAAVSYRLVELFLLLLDAECRVLNLVGCPMWMHAEESLDNRDPVGQE